jgi:hypothetical protein
VRLSLQRPRYSCVSLEQEGWRGRLVVPDNYLAWHHLCRLRPWDCWLQPVQGSFNSLYRSECKTCSSFHLSPHRAVLGASREANAPIAKRKARGWPFCAPQLRRDSGFGANRSRSALTRASTPDFNRSILLGGNKGLRAFAWSSDRSVRIEFVCQDWPEQNPTLAVELHHLKLLVDAPIVRCG